MRVTRQTKRILERRNRRIYEQYIATDEFGRRKHPVKDIARRYDLSEARVFQIIHEVEKELGDNLLLDKLNKV